MSKCEKREVYNFDHECPEQYAAWHAKRAENITGSDISMLLGMSYFGGPEKVLENKLASSFKDSRAKAWGRKCEEDNLKYISDIFQLRTRPTHAMVVDPERRMSATLDGLVAAPTEERENNFIYFSAVRRAQRVYSQLCAMRGVGLLEMKQTGTRNTKEWGTVPDGYFCQLQMQMHVSRIGWALIACKIGNDNMAVHVVERDDHFIETQIFPAVEKFWDAHGDFLLTINNNGAK